MENSEHIDPLKTELKMVFCAGFYMTFRQMLTPFTKSVKGFLFF